MSRTAVDLPEVAVLALIRWRRAWERDAANPPTANMGHTPSDLYLWRVAGRLMRIRKIPTRLPG